MPVELYARATVSLDQIDDMRRTLQWWHELLPKTAKEELAKEHARGNLENETVLVDGRKGARVVDVKPFGKIQYVGGLGPIEAAIIAADAIAHAAAPRRSGHYARSLVWFANGRATGGPPTAREIGARGNAELVDLAPYANMVEIQVPRGVIYQAYNSLARQFGGTLSIGFRFVPAAKFGGHLRAAGDPGRTFLNVPVLSIGHPSGNVRPGVARSRPGSTIARRRRSAARSLRSILDGGGQ